MLNIYTCGYPIAKGYFVIQFNSWNETTAEFISRIKCDIGKDKQNIIDAIQANDEELTQIFSFAEAEGLIVKLRRYRMDNISYETLYNVDNGMFTGCLAEYKAYMRGVLDGMIYVPKEIVDFTVT